MCSSDVVVVGAGPAGSATAWHLARSGWSVKLVDSARFPRDKVCGDFVGPGAVQWLQEMGVADMAGFDGCARIRRAAVHLDGAELLCRPMATQPGLPDHGIVAPRKLLDQWILNAATDAGAELLEGHRVVGFRTGAEGVTVDAENESAHVTLRGRLLVGADGSNSLIARTTSRDYPWRYRSIVAVRAYFEDVGGDPERADLFFSSDYFPGYCWIFPAGRGSANVGVGVLRDAVPPRKVQLKGLLERLVNRDQALGRRLAAARQVSPAKGWPLAIYDPGRRVVADRVVLVGDAAGLIHPLNGEGIQYSLDSALWAADAISPCLESGDLSAPALAPYARRLDLEMHQDMAVANLVVRCIGNRLLNPLWMEALRSISARAKRDDDYAEIAGGILAGLVPAARAMQPGFLAKTLEEALALAVRQSAERLARSRGALAGDARSAVDAAVSTFKEAARSPGSIVGWGLDLATGATDLAFEVTRSLVRRMGRR